MTSTTLLSCFSICSSDFSSPPTTIVIRETVGSSVMLTASDSMLNPRRENNPETRASTPGLFSTSAVIVCCNRLFHFRELRTHRQVRIRLPGRDHWIDVLLRRDGDVQHHRDVLHLVALVQCV